MIKEIQSAALSRRSSTSIPFHSIKEDPSEWQEDITSLNLNKTDMAAFVTCHEVFLYSFIHLINAIGFLCS